MPSYARHGSASYRQEAPRQKTVFGDDRTALGARHPNGVSREEQLRSELGRIESVCPPTPTAL